MRAGVRYLFSRDPVIAETFCRKLAWHQVGCPLTALRPPAARRPGLVCLVKSWWGSTVAGRPRPMSPAQVMLWPEEMADATLLVLSGQDDLVPSEMVQHHLRHTKSPCKVLLPLLLCCLTSASFGAGHPAWASPQAAAAQASASSFRAWRAAQVLCNPTAGHGGFLLDQAFGQKVLATTQEVVLAGALMAKKAA